MVQYSVMTPDTGDVSCASCQSRISGTDSVMEPTQMTASLAMMDWHCSMGRALAWGLVAAWNLSMPRAQRLKVVTPSDDTWREGRQNKWALLEGHHRGLDFTRLVANPWVPKTTAGAPSSKVVEVTAYGCIPGLEPLFCDS